MKKTHIILLIFVASCIGFLAVQATSGSFSTYETFATAYSDEGKKYTVIGELVREDEMYYNPKENPDYFAFFMKDKAGDVKKVEFTGAKPQDFTRSEELVLTGNMDGEVFKASKILMKCPSKYVDDEMVIEEVNATSVDG